jgi:hypothetical protein
LKYLWTALLSMFLVAPITLLARDANSGSVNIPSQVVVAGHQLAPGHYKLEWQQEGQRVEVNFVSKGKTVASVPATLRTNDAQVTQDDVVTRHTASKQNRLMEIDFGHQKEALMFAGQSRS